MTHRPALVKALTVACDAMHALGVRPLRVRQFTTTSELSPAADTAAFLVIDLGAPHGTADVVADATRWATQNREGQLILVGTNSDPSWVGPVCYHLGRLATGELVDVAHSNDPEYWKDVILQHPLARVMDGLQQAVRDALYRTVGDAAVPNLSMIWQLFTFAPRNFAIAQIVRGEQDGRTTKSKMNAFAGLLAHHQQASPREFVAAFRLLLYLTLKADYYASDRTRWRTPDIEAALAQPLDELHRSLRKCTGHTIRTLETLEQAHMIAVIVDMITARDGRRSLKERVTEALRAAADAGRRTSRGRSAAFRIALMAPLAIGLVLCGGDYDGDGIADVQRARRVLLVRPHAPRTRDAA